MILNRKFWTWSHLNDSIYIDIQALDLDPSHLFPGFTTLQFEIANFGHFVGEDTIVIKNETSPSVVPEQKGFAGNFLDFFFCSCIQSRH